MIDTSLSWKIVQSSMADNTLNVVFTSGLLDILAIIFVLFGLGVFVFSLRKRAVAPSDHSLRPPRRPVAVLSVAMLALPLLGLIFVWTNVSQAPLPVPPTPTPIVVRHTPTPVPTPSLDLVTPGTLTVGTYTTYAPQEFTDANGKPTGFDIALTYALAKEMKLKNVHIVTKSFPDLLPALGNKTLDVVIAGIAIDPTLQGQAEFVPYLKSVETLMVPNANPKHITQLNDLCGLKVGVVSGTPADTDLKNIDCKSMGKKDITINDTQTDPAQIVQLLQSSQIDVAYLDVPVANYYMNMRQYKGLFTTVGTMPETVNQGIAIRTGDTGINNAVMLALQALHTDGTYNKLLKSNGWDFTSEAYPGH